jgi:hypothetical protein
VVEYTLFGRNASLTGWLGLEVERLVRVESGNLRAEDDASFGAGHGCYLPFPLQAGMTLDRFEAVVNPFCWTGAPMLATRGYGPISVNRADRASMG